MSIRFVSPIRITFVPVAVGVNVLVAVGVDVKTGVGVIVFVIVAVGVYVGVDVKTWVAVLVGPDSTSRVAYREKWKEALLEDGKVPGIVPKV